MKKRTLFTAIIICMLLVNGRWTYAQDSSTSEEEQDAADFIMKMHIGNDWLDWPSDDDINQAFSDLPKGEQGSDEYGWWDMTYNYTSPQKVHVSALENSPKYRFYSNQVLIIAHKTGQSQSTLLKNEPIVYTDMYSFMVLEYDRDGFFYFENLDYIDNPGPSSSSEAPVYYGKAAYSSGWIEGELESSQSQNPSIQVPITSPEEESDLPWEVVVGGGAAIGAVAVAMAKNAKKTKKAGGKSPENPKVKKEKDKAEDEKKVGYIIDLSEDRIVVSEGSPYKLGVRILEVDGAGNWKLAQGVSSQVILTPDTKLSVTPLNGASVLNMTLNQMESISEDKSEMVTINAYVSGQTLTANVTVDMKATWRMVFR